MVCKGGRCPSIGTDQLRPVVSGAELQCAKFARPDFCSKSEADGFRTWPVLAHDELAGSDAFRAGVAR
jgi:hypothetical protein